MVRFLLTLAWTVAVLPAAAAQRLAFATQAQSQFDRVQLAAAAPELRDTSACTQAQAAFVSVAMPEELAPTHFRKGFCMLAGAAITRNTAEFTEAAAEFDKAIEAWPAHAHTAGKKAPP